VRTVNNPITALKTIRIVHLYLGVFVAPAILFFAFTGALQTFSLHDVAKDGSYRPANWIVSLAQLHKKQTKQLPAPKDPSTMNSSKDDPKPQKKHDSVSTHSTLPMKIFFLVVSIGLFLSTLTSLSMSYMYCRNKVSLTAILLAGVAVPVALAMV
jgi:hypothetical protein